FGRAGEEGWERMGRGRLGGRVSRFGSRTVRAIFPSPGFWGAFGEYLWTNGSVPQRTEDATNARYICVFGWSPVSVTIQVLTLSRRKHGFESRRARQRSPSIGPGSKARLQARLSGVAADRATAAWSAPCRIPF